MTVAAVVTGLGCAVLAARNTTAGESPSLARQRAFAEAARLCREGAPRQAIEKLDGLSSEIQAGPALSILRQRAEDLIAMAPSTAVPDAGEIVAQAISPSGTGIAVIDARSRLVVVSRLEDGHGRRVAELPARQGIPVILHRESAIHVCYPTGWISRFDLAAGQLTHHRATGTGVEQIVPIDEREDMVLRDSSGGLTRVHGRSLQVVAATSVRQPGRIQDASSPADAVVWLSQDGAVDVYSLADLRLRASFSATGEKIRFARLLGAKAVIACGDRGTLTRWSLQDGESRIREADPGSERVSHFEVRGDWIAMAQGATVRIFAGSSSVLTHVATLPVGCGVADLKLFSAAHLCVVTEDGHLLTYSLLPVRAWASRWPSTSLFSKTLWPMAKWFGGQSIGEPFWAKETGTLVAWDRKAEVVRSFPLHGAPHSMVHELAQEGTWIARAANPSQVLAVWQDPVVLLIDRLLGGAAARLDIGERYLSMSVTPDGARLAVGTVSGVARTWDLRTAREELSIDGMPRGHVEVCCIKDGVIAGDRTGRVFLRRNSESPMLIARLGARISAMACDAAGGQLFVGAANGELRCIDLLTGSARWSDSRSPGLIHELSVSGNGRLLAVARAGSRAGIRLASTGEIVKCPSQAVDVVSCLWEPNRERVALVTREGALVFWRESGVLTAIGLPCGRGRPAWHPRGQVLATTGRRNEILLWDAESGQLIHELRGHREDVSGYIFTRSGREIMSISLDGTLRAWPIEAK